MRHYPWRAAHVNSPRSVRSLAVRRCFRPATAPRRRLASGRARPRSRPPAGPPRSPGAGMRVPAHQAAEQLHGRQGARLEPVLPPAHGLAAISGWTARATSQVTAYHSRCPAGGPRRGQRTLMLACCAVGGPSATCLDRSGQTVDVRTPLVARACDPAATTRRESMRTRTRIALALALAVIVLFAAAPVKQGHGHSGSGACPTCGAQPAGCSPENTGAYCGCVENDVWHDPDWISEEECPAAGKCRWFEL